MEEKRCKCCGELKPISEYKMTGKGLMNTCAACWRQHVKEGQVKSDENERLRSLLAEARNARLDSFTPRELMKYLAKIGFQGVLTFTKVEKVDITKL